MNKLIRPSVREVVLCDDFWKPYLEKVRKVTMPHVFNKFEETGFFDGFHMVIDGVTGLHKKPPFGDGLIYESMRGACDFLAAEYDAALDARLDRYIELIRTAQDVSGDGYICTKTTCQYPDWRWGEGDGDIVYQHDLYDHGALAEAAISHYLATGKTTFLACAVKGANLICSHIGYPPKHNVIPGHSLPEEAFIKLYRLFRDHRELDDFAKEHGVRYEDYLDIVMFWYDNRGNHKGRNLAKDPKFTPKYNQDHAPFSQQTTAEGHAVRAALCYAGAAMATYETGREDYIRSLDAVWENIHERKLHISGGIGTRHDIEGFDNDYDLPHNAYLETCAGIAFAFFNGEMSLLAPSGKYFDAFERSLYNNVLASIAEDGAHYFYKNPLVSDGSIRRWEWHVCPCCPPMLLKLYSSLASYIYAYSDSDLYLNMHIDSKVNTDLFEAELSGGHLRVNSYGKPMTLHIRIPDYAENVSVLLGGQAVDAVVDGGYAVFEGVWNREDVEVRFCAAPRFVAADPRAEANRGQAAIMCGPMLYCAESMDNGGSLEVSLTRDMTLEKEGDSIVARGTNGVSLVLIPYYRWCNREHEDQAMRQMRVWFPYSPMPSDEELSEMGQGKLYFDLFG